MSQSLSKVMIHLVFSTKDRAPLINTEIRPRLHAYIAGSLDNLQSPSIRTGGTADHVHSLFVLGRTISQAQVVKEIKTSSSKWIKTECGIWDFSWQAGYGAFSIGESQIEALVQYISNQEEHHKKSSFQDEYRTILAKYRIVCDERYVWD